MKKFTITYALPAALIIILDQWTKWLVESFWPQGLELTSFLSFKLTLNKGISWGLLHKAGD